MPVDVKLLKPEDAKVLLSTKPLGDPAVGPSLVDAIVAADQSFAGKAITVSLGGTLSIHAFNSEDDEDEDGVLGAPSGDGPGGLAPQLRLTPDDAFVKYRCGATVKATAAGTALKAIGFDFEGSAEDLESYGATALFLERASLSRPGFSASDRDAAAIALLCRRLDGIPLAIELAAARVKALSVPQILERLAHASARGRPEQRRQQFLFDVTRRKRLAKRRGQELE